MTLIRRSRLRRLQMWFEDDSPDWLGGLMIDRLRFDKFVCRIDGHAPFVEMDNVSICCAYCTKLLGRTKP